MYSELTITNTSANLGTYISRLFTAYYTDDEVVLKAQAWINETIDRYKYKPATPMNCQVLQSYIREQMLAIRKRPWSKARNELLWQCKRKIDTLQTGIGHDYRQTIENNLL